MLKAVSMMASALPHRNVAQPPVVMHAVNLVVREVVGEVVKVAEMLK